MHSMDSMAAFLMFEAAAACLALGALIFYPILMRAANRTHRRWPARRLVFWTLGVLAAVAALVGPLAQLSHSDFTVHMLGHLLLGMLAPLLMLMARPMTLLMRALPVRHARKLSRILNFKYVHFISNPAVASVLNIGGLFLLYKTGLFTAMHTSTWLFALIHLHVFLAGYLFTMSIVYLDITTRRYSFIYRAVVLIIALGFHKILSKLIYAAPPEGVPQAEGEAGAMLMYYGGDVIDLALIIILCSQWYQSRAPKPAAR
ncbi:cytochrome c oxidase assembly protein [Salinicoccus siamensis]|uniref:Cytochrome c oxidase assembly protein n=1 Tax=Salinicoccus siamensis TaxID=381830 RepID=A0ABV5Z2B1_9STAP